MRLPGGRIYLDCNATTPVDPIVAEVMERASSAVFGNPSSPYLEGREALGVLEASRESVSDFVGCEPREIVFTASGTEANHLALRSAALARPARTRVLVSAIEHPSVMEQRPALEKSGCSVEEIPVNASGQVDLSALETMLDGHVSVVSLMTAHNETGVLQPVTEAAKLAHAAGALFHTDSVQAAGKIPLPWRDAEADYLVLAAHKFYGPKGIAALAARDGAPVEPLLTGGGQERGLRASTEAVPLAAGMARACERARKTAGLWPAVEVLRDELESELKKKYGAAVFGADAPRLPNTSFLSIPGADAQRLVAELDACGFAVATGSACHSGSAACPRVLARMGLDGVDGASVLRITLGRMTTGLDVHALLGALPGALEAAKRRDA